MFNFPSRTFLLVTCGMSCFISVNSQTNFQSMEAFNDSYLRFHIKYLTVKPKTDFAYGGFTANLSWDSKDYKKWDKRFMWEQNLFSDVVAMIVKKYVMKKPITKSGLDHSFSTGIFGSFQLGPNVIAKEKLIVSPCVSFGDFITAVQQEENTGNNSGIENNGKLYRDPAGYFFVAGPSVVVSFIPMPKFWIDAYFVYDFTAYNVGEKNISNFVHEEGYPNPHFISCGMNFNHKSGFFTGLRFYSLVNRGNTNTGINRTDINIGYHL